jgi:hypothetical protein
VLDDIRGNYFINPYSTGRYAMYKTEAFLMKSISSNLFDFLKQTEILDACFWLRKDLLQRSFC